jgi:hypothetical protein
MKKHYIPFELVEWIVLAHDMFQWWAFNFFIEQLLSSPEGLFCKATVHSSCPMKPSRMSLNNLAPVNTQHLHPFCNHYFSSLAVLSLRTKYFKV